MAHAVELIDARNNFYIGNYQNCLKLLQSINASDPESQLLKDIFTYRTYIAQKKYGVVLDEVLSHSAVSNELKAIRLLAEYLSDDTRRDSLLKQMEDHLNSNLSPNDETSLIIAATIYLHEGAHDIALKALRNGESLECMALTVQTYLAMDRSDLARKELKRMQESNEDDPLCQLSMAMFHLSTGGEKLQEAYHIYREMADRYAPTPALLNGQAAAYMGMNRWEDAEPLVQEALDLDTNNPETLVNMVVLSQHLGKAPEVSNRYLSQLKDGNRQHPFMQNYLTKESEFDRLVKNYSASCAS